MPNTLDTTTLQMALIDYEDERQKIQAKIAEQAMPKNLRIAVPSQAHIEGFG